MQNKDFRFEYQWKANLVFASVALIMVYRVASATLFSQMAQPLFLFEDNEWLYRLLLSSGLPQFLISNQATSLLFDALLFLLPVLFLFTLRRGFVAAYTVLIVFYFMTFNLITGHHYHSLAGLIVMTIPFWFQKEEKFELAWNLARYYLLYIFASAALWKITRGTAFDADHLSNILKSQQLDILIQEPESWRAHIARYLISHERISYAILLANTALQLCFLAGFFTNRFDTILFWLFILFCIGNYFVMSIISSELLILNLTLLNWKALLAFLRIQFPNRV